MEVHVPAVPMLIQSWSWPRPREEAVDSPRSGINVHVGRRLEDPPGVVRKSDEHAQVVIVHGRFVARSLEDPP